MCHDPNFTGPDVQRPLVCGRTSLISLLISFRVVRRSNYGRAVARAGTPMCAHAHAGAFRHEHGQ